jgi:transcriptional regulator with XRE-family HTH domain
MAWDERSGSSPEPGPAGKQLLEPQAHARAFGARLRTLRKWCRASRRALAKASGVSVYALRRYEEGRAVASFDHLELIAQALHANVLYLHSGIEPPSEADIAEMRLWWKLDRVSPDQAATVLHLIDGILSQISSQISRRSSAAGG